MATSFELNHDQWHPFFARLNRDFKGRGVALQHSDDRHGLESEVQSLPLLGISADETREGIDTVVRVQAGYPGRGSVTEFVAAPTRVHFTEDADGKVGLLQIESRTGQVLVVDFGA